MGTVSRKMSNNSLQVLSTGISCYAWRMSATLCRNSVCQFRQDILNDCFTIFHLFSLQASWRNWSKKKLTTGCHKLERCVGDIISRAIFGCGSFLMFSIVGHWHQRNRVRNASSSLARWGHSKGMGSQIGIPGGSVTFFGADSIYFFRGAFFRGAFFRSTNRHLQ